MELTDEQIRLLVMHEWRAGLKGQKVTSQINEIWGEGTTGKTAVYKWIARLKAGETNLKDQPRSRRPKEVNRQAVLEAIEETPSLTTRMFAEDFDCCFKTTTNISYELGKIWKATRWVPHELTSVQKTNRLNVAQSLPNRHRPNQAVFLDDNPKPHRSRMTNAKTEELGWDRLVHPAYSPDLAPSDFHLFRSL